MAIIKLTTFKSNKILLVSKTKKAGRNNTGRITVRHQGGGEKQFYRTINWSRSESKGIVANFEYDPNRSAVLAKLYHPEEGNSFQTSYILAPKSVKIFDEIKTYNSLTKNIALSPGDRTLMANFEAGDFIHAVETIPDQRPIFARSAGTFCQVLQHDSVDYAKIRLPSGSQRLISLKAKATLGVLANEEHNLKILGKAGRSRWLNIRPSVRGVAMNPVDHPHGGGQGKTKGGRPSVTPWSLPTKGQPTKNSRKKSKLILTARKSKRK